MAKERINFFINDITKKETDFEYQGRSRTQVENNYKALGVSCNWSICYYIRYNYLRTYLQYEFSRQTIPRFPQKTNHVWKRKRR